MYTSSKKLLLKCFFSWVIHTYTMKMAFKWLDEIARMPLEVDDWNKKKVQYAIFFKLKQDVIKLHKNLSI